MAMRTFYRFFMTLSLVLTPSVMSAVSAYPELIEFCQPDGTVIHIRMQGHEGLKWAETSDGYSLVYDKEGFFVFAEQNTLGDMIPSRFRACDIDKRSFKITEHLSKLPKHLTFSHEQMTIADEIIQKQNLARAKVFHDSKSKAVTGERKFLVVLMEFTDRKFTRTRQEFDNLFNQIGYSTDGNQGSVRDFYHENSFGQLDLTSTVTGIFTASRNAAFYGGNKNGGSDDNPQALAVEALQKAATKVNLQDFDYDNDGYIDGVHIIYAGHGEEAGGGADCIWAHQSTTTGSFCTVGGVKMNRYSCSPELRNASGTDMTYIGVACHEIGHALGTMDFYDTNYNLGGQYPAVGKWDVMASGNWNGGGTCPAHFNPYTKIYDFGWSDVKNGCVAANVTLHSKTKDDFYRIDTKTPGEYFLLEYRSKDGFDAQIPGHGMMVYRASENLSRASQNTINAYHRQQFYPLCANAGYSMPTSTASTYGTVDAPSAPWPGTLGKTQLTDNTKPSMMNWNEDPTGFPITDILEDVYQGCVSFRIAGGDGYASNLQIAQTGIDDICLKWYKGKSQSVMLVYNTTGTFGAPGQKDYSPGEDIAGGGKVLYLGAEETYTHSGLAEGTAYYYQLFSRATASGEWALCAQTTGYTPYTIVRSYPFSEDFERGVLDEGWRQEVVQGSKEWRVEKALNNKTSYLLHYDSTVNSGEIESVRIVMPTFDFSGQKGATLEFDYRNLLLALSVQYRTSPEDSWHNLLELERDMTYQKTPDEIFGMERHIVLRLPYLSCYYEIAFLPHCGWDGNSKSSLEIGTIDNIKITCFETAYIQTGNVVSSGNDNADVLIYAYSNSRTDILATGIEYGTAITNLSQKVYLKEGATTDQDANGTATVHIAGLQKNTRYYYRAFCETPSGKVYGTTQSFTTRNISFATGDGSKEAPFIISSNSDWRTLRSLVIGGEQCKNLHFRLSADITLTQSDFISSGNTKYIFDGHIDGDGHTISFPSRTASTKGFPLIHTIGDNAVIENLLLNWGNLTYSAGNNGAYLCYFNYGIIRNVDFRTGKIIIQNTNGDNILYVRNNFGTISTCSANIELMRAEYGKNNYLIPIVGYNNGIVIGCSTHGILESIGEPKGVWSGACASGICNVNWETGRIVGCISDMTIRSCATDMANYNGLEMTGISSSNYGQIEQCAFKGNITFNEMDSGAGICRTSDKVSASIRNSYSAATIQKRFTSSAPKVAGLVWWNRVSSILDNCISNNKVYAANGSVSGLRDAVVDQQEAIVTNCYYTTPGSSACATGISPDLLASMDFVDLLNTHAGGDVWTTDGANTTLSFEKDGTILFFNQESSKTTNNSLGFDFLYGGKGIVDSGIEWTLAGQDAWESITCTPGKTLHTLKNLYAGTLYDVRGYVVLDNGQRKYSASVTTSTMLDGTGTADDPYRIATYEEMLAFANLVTSGVNFTQKTVRLTADIDMHADKGLLWTPITGFEAADFDGGGHYISNVHVNSNSPYTGGIFGLCYNTAIHDLHLRNAYVELEGDLGTDYGSWDLGGIVSTCQALERCSFIGSIRFKHTLNSWATNSSAAGVLAGSATVKDCYGIANVTSNRAFGGITGRGNIENSYFAQFSQDIGKYGNLTSLICNNRNNYSATNCYFLNSSINSTCTDGTPLTEQQMKDGTLLKKLGTDIWTDNINGKKLDGGYPVLKSQQAEPETEPDEPDDDWSDTPYLPDTTIYAGHTIEIPLNIRCTEEISAYQLDMTLPEGVTIPKDEDGEFMIDFGSRTTYKRHTISCMELPGGIIHIECYSTKNYTFNGLDGDVATITFHVDEDCIDGNYNILLYNIVLTTVQGKKIEPTLIKSKLTIVSLTPGDVNNDKNVDFADISITASHILGQETTGFVSAAADVNADHSVDVVDISCIAGIILQGSSNRLPEQSIVMLQTDSPENYFELTSMQPVYTGAQTPIQLKLHSLVPISGYQLDLQFQQGMSIETDSDGEFMLEYGSRTTYKRHTLSSGEIEDGAMRILCYSSRNLAFNNLDGDVAILTIRVDNNAISGPYVIKLSNIILTTPDSQKITLANTQYSFHVEDEEDAIKVVNVCNHENETYDLFGRRTNGQKGLHIIRYEDGSVKKVVKN